MEALLADLIEAVRVGNGLLQGVLLAVCVLILLQAVRAFR